MECAKIVQKCTHSTHRHSIQRDLLPYSIRNNCSSLRFWYHAYKRQTKQPQTMFQNSTLRVHNVILRVTNLITSGFCSFFPHTPHPCAICRAFPRVCGPLNNQSLQGRCIKDVKVCFMLYQDCPALIKFNMQ